MEVAIPGAVLTALLTHYMREPYKSQPVGKRLTKGKRGPSKTGPHSFSPMNGADLKVRPPVGRVPSSVPRAVSNQIVWDVVSYDNNLTASASGAVVENNFNFALSYHPQAASWAALFDQWCIPQASVTYQSQLSPGSTTNPCVLYTALDFDSTNNLGQVTAIEDFSTCETAVMNPQTSVIRSIHPCNKATIQTTAGTALSGVQRNWCDSAQPTSFWVGIRTITAGGSSAMNINAKVTVWFAFRNQI